MGNLEHLKLLRTDMEAKGWTISSFIFIYKNIKYVVLVKLFIGPIKKVNPYALVQLEFMKYNNIQDNYVVEAHSNSLLDDIKSIRKYFGIVYGPNMGQLMEQFAQTLNKVVPTQVPNPNSYDNTQLECLNSSLSRSDSEDPTKIYCYGTIMNPVGKQRSPFNSDKTKLNRPVLFQKLGGDLRRSFCYSNDPQKKKSDAEIIASINKP